MEQQQYNLLLKKIANTLYINSQHLEGDGLLKGKMGITLFFHHYARYTGNSVYTDCADEFLDYILGRMAKDTVLDFANGLSGIAWGIDYLIKNRFVEADDNFLNDVDRIIENIIPSDFLKETDYSLPLFSKGLYFIQRKKSEKIRETILQLGELISLNQALPDSYLQSIRFFLTESIKLNIEKERCLQIGQRLPQKNKDIQVSDTTDFYNRCWEYFLYSASNEIIKGTAPDLRQLEAITDQKIENLNNQSLSIYQGLAGLGILLIKLCD